MVKFNIIGGGWENINGVEGKSRNYRPFRIFSREGS